MNELDLRAVFDAAQTLGFHIRESDSSEGFPDHSGNVLKLRRAAEILGFGGSVSAIDKAVNALNKLNAEESFEPLPSPEAVRRVLSHAVHRFSEDAGEVRFFSIDCARARYYSDEHLNELGEVFDSLPNVLPHLRDAEYCYAAGLPTASVFHLMSALEDGIRSLSNRFRGIKKPPSSSQTWGSWINSIEAYANPRTPSVTGQPRKRAINRRHRAKLLSIIASLQHIKNAWRDTTMRVKATYSDEDARVTYDASQKVLSEIAELVAIRL